MIVVGVVRNASGGVERLTLEGHSGLAAAGKDIVCAAASTLVESLAASLEDLLGLDVSVELRAGWFDLRVGQKGTEQAQLLLAHTIHGLRSVERAFPDRLRVESRQEG